MKKSEMNEELRDMLRLLENAPDYFQLLGVHKASTPEEIKLRRNELARALHPDRWMQDVKRRDAAARAMASVNQAASVLTTKALRTRYLVELASGRSVCPSCRGEGYARGRKGIGIAMKTACLTCHGSGLYSNN